MSSHPDSLHGSTLPSERTFGFVFTGIFLILAGYLWYHDGKPVAIQVFLVLAVAGAVIAVFLLVAMPSPSIDAKRLISRLSGELV